MKIFNDKSIELNEYFEQLNKEKEVKKELFDECYKELTKFINDTEES